MSINWYMSLYHKYRDYPIAHINTNYKRNQLKTIYENIFIRLSSYFYIKIPDHFHIKTQIQSQSALLQARSNRKNMENHSSGCSSMHSKFLQSNHNMMKKLKSHSIFNDGDGISYGGDRSMASIRYFKEEDFAVDQFQRIRVEGIGNFLKFVINTGKQTLCDLLIQQQNTQKSSSYEFPDQQSNLQKSQPIKSQKNTSSHITTTKKPQPCSQIAIQIIPEDNQQINYYFLQFCSTIEIEDLEYLVNNLPKSRMEGNSNQVSLKDLMVSFPYAMKGQHNNLDGILLQIMGKQLGFSNNYLARFQYLVHSSKNVSNNNQSNLNIIIETWLELVTMLQNQTTIYQIIQELVKGNGNPFSEKISSYLHFICLVNTKSLLAKTVSKQNFLSILPDFISGIRTLKDFKLDMNHNFIKICDSSLDRYIYSSQAYKKVLEKWRHLGQIISEILIQDDSIFWAKVLQSCCQLLDRYLEEKVQLSYSLIVLYQSLEQDETNSTFINLSQWKRNFYQRSIKMILQKQIGGIESQLSVSRSQIKSKISLRKTGPKTSQNLNKLFFSCDNHHFIFYDQKNADRDQKILQLRQWEKVVKQSIEQLKAYRRILDTGLQLFSGIPQYITIFFLETYFNFKKVSVYSTFNLSQTVNKYCNKISTSSYLKSLPNTPPTSTPQIPTQQQKPKPILLQLETHQQNYKQIYKQITTIYRCRQLSASPNLHPNMKQLSLISTNSYNMNDRQKSNQNDKNQYQSVFSEYQTNYSQGFNDGLPVLGEEFVVGAVERMMVGDEQQCELAQIQDMMTIGQVNRHLKLVNECNYILNTIQISQPLTPKPNPDSLLILTTTQLTQSLTKLALEQQAQQSKTLMMQTQYHRKTSNISKNHRMSSVNVTNKKNSLNTNQRIEVDLGKIRQRIFLHNQCLELVVLGYCKYVLFYRLLGRNLGCLRCCGLGQDTANANSIGEVEKQRQYREIASRKFITTLKKYQQLHTRKPQKQTHPQQLTLTLQQQLQLTNLNTQILIIFMYMSSLHIDNHTFSAIYKQDLISEQKMKKIKVIGKQYYQSMHQLYMRTNGGICGGQVQVQRSGVQGRKNLYLENLLVVLVGIIQLMYQRAEECSDLSAYTTLLRKYFISKANLTSKNQSTKLNEDLLNIHKIISQSFDWNQQNIPQLGEKQLMYQLLELRMRDESETFSEQLRQIIDKEFQVLKKYQDAAGRVEYLEKKLLYLMLREVYFDSYYDIGVFQVKSVQARKNFAMYEIKMVSFFQEIIQKDQQQFLLLKSEQLKQRSAHLKGYLVDYQKQPNIHSQQKNCLIKIVCIFSKTLNLVTQNRKYEMKKRGSNSITVLRKNMKKSQPIYMHYVSTQLVKPNKQRVRVFQNQGYFFYRAIQIYQEMLCKKVEDSQKKFSIYKQLGFSVPTEMCVSFHDADLETIRQNKDSLLALWINYEYKNLHQSKMLLSHQNYLSKIEKLYIDLDVRHKVFQSFKDKILNYEMQKTKIYHQYMDYIRGLKLDVYSHVSGEDPIPYFKLINAIKVYRLDVKKRELEEKIQEEFGKNLSKWNEGIVQDMKIYHEWITKQAKVWQRMNQGTKKYKKQLFEIYTIVHKQLRKQQNKTIYIAEYSLKLKQNTPKTTIKTANIRRSIQKQKSLYK